MPIEPIVLEISSNFTYILSDGTLNFIIDPADFITVDRYLLSHNLLPSLIINTHHHADHTEGNLRLKNKYHCPVLGGDPRIPGIDKLLSDGEQLATPAAPLRIIHTPGHTRGSICIQAGQNLFTGDTLFTAGCGRVFEGTFRTLYRSLRRLSEMDPQLLIYGGHNYIRENLQFALSLFPKDPAICDFLQRVEESEINNRDYVISNLAEELLINPFLRADNLAVFTRWRKRKDCF
jgi:hydroxyacylglutathione hydrolase